MRRDVCDPLEIAVNRPAAEVWKRVGKFCDIGEWLRIPCTITSGTDGEFGAVRSVANEVLAIPTLSRSGRGGRTIFITARSKRGR